MQKLEFSTRWERWESCGLVRWRRVQRGDVREERFLISWGACRRGRLRESGDTDRAWDGDEGLGRWRRLGSAVRGWVVGLRWDWEWVRLWFVSEICELESEICEWESETKENRDEGAAMWAERKWGFRNFRVYNIIYIYIWGYFSNYIIIYPSRVRSGSGQIFTKTRTRFGFFFLKKKTQTRPYSLSGQVKSNPLGSGRARYPRFGQKLPSLVVGDAKKMNLEKLGCNWMNLFRNY